MCAYRAGGDGWGRWVADALGRARVRLRRARGAVAPSWAHGGCCAGRAEVARHRLHSGGLGQSGALDLSDGLPVSDCVNPAPTPLQYIQHPPTPTPPPLRIQCPIHPPQPHQSGTGVVAQLEIGECGGRGADSPVPGRLRHLSRRRDCACWPGTPSPPSRRQCSTSPRCTAWPPRRAGRSSPAQGGNRRRRWPRQSTRCWRDRGPGRRRRPGRRSRPDRG